MISTSKSASIERRARHHLSRFDRTLIIILAIGASAAISLLSHGALPLPFVGVSAVGVGLILGLIDWHLSVRCLLLYTPLSGIATVLLYPNTAAASVVKDLMFVVPAYIGFALWKGKDRLVPIFWAPLLVTVLIAIVQSVNPGVPNALVALVGFKTYFWYVPMLFLGFYLITSSQDLYRLLRILSLTALVPSIIGITQALLMYSGRRDLAISLYGSAASTMTQDDANILISGSTTFLRRVPSTFPYTTQYYIYLGTMLCCTYAWWMIYKNSHRTARRFGPIILLTIIVAALLSGQRGAFLFIPFLLGILVALHTQNLNKRGVFAPLMAVLAIAVAFYVLSRVSGATPGSVVRDAWEIGRDQFGFLFIDGLARVTDRSIYGMGTGYSTNAARQFFPGGTLEVWEESLYIKAYLELGLVGLITYVIFLVGTVVMIFRSMRSLKESSLRPLAVGTLALVIWTLVYGLKASLLDLDPLNFYFWLLTGITLRLPEIASKSDVKVDQAVTTNSERTSPRFAHAQKASNVHGATV